MSRSDKLIKAVLRDCYQELISDLSLEAVPWLWKEGFITEADRDSIISERGDRSKRKEIFDILRTKDDSALEALIEFLDEDGTQNHLADSLKQSKQKFSSATSTSSRSKSKLSIWFCEEPTNFCGRSEELISLHKHLTAERTTGITHNKIGSISGRGGIGKSSLARAYAYTYHEYYDSVIWIDAENLQAVNSSLEALYKRTGRKFENIEKFYGVFSCTRNPWLLILDNVEDPDFIQKFLPKGLRPDANKPHILVTSRATIWPTEVAVLELELLTEDEAELFILAYDIGSFILNTTTRESRLKLAQTLLFWPLAIKQAVVESIKIVVSNSEFGIRTGDPIEQYLKLYNTCL